MLEAFKARHEVVLSGLNAISGIQCLPSQGTFYSFPDFRSVIAASTDIQDDIAMAEYLIEKAGVALVPGSAFGTPGFMRLSFATSLENLQEAIKRIAASVR